MKQWQSDNNQCTMAKGKLYSSTVVQKIAEENLNADQIFNHLNELLLYYPSPNLLRRGYIVAHCLYKCVCVQKLVRKIEKTISTYNQQSLQTS